MPRRDEWRAARPINQNGAGLHMDNGTQPPAASRILVVDDDADFFALLYDALTHTMPDCAIVGVRSAEAALVELEQGRFDLILIDYRLEGRNGLALLGDLRSLAPALPVIMITGYPTQSLRQQAETLGVSGFLIKPVFVPDLRRAVLAALAGR
jgi:CheY-like chemotaxis protein